mmetsp:Transcript_16116/g.15908  ORF Transcript_16116/g.15908 Transcript_16116/m.15908 type:complete len:101 (+) Transcript_16116:3-305(+)
MMTIDAMSELDQTSVVIKASHRCEVLSRDVLGIGKNKESYAIDSYGVDTDLCFSFPVITDGESWTKVGGLEMTEFGYSMLQRNIQELKAERDMVRNLMGW